MSALPVFILEVLQILFFFHGHPFPPANLTNPPTPRLFDPFTMWIKYRTPPGPTIERDYIGRFFFFFFLHPFPPVSRHPSFTSRRGPNYRNDSDRVERGCACILECIERAAAGGGASRCEQGQDTVCCDGAAPYTRKQLGGERQQHSVAVVQRRRHLGSV